MLNKKHVIFYEIMLYNWHDVELPVAFYRSVSTHVSNVKWAIITNRICKHELQFGLSEWTITGCIILARSSYQILHKSIECYVMYFFTYMFGACRTFVQQDVGVYMVNLLATILFTMNRFYRKLHGWSSSSVIGSNSIQLACS